MLRSLCDLVPSFGTATDELGVSNRWVGSARFRAHRMGWLPLLVNQRGMLAIASTVHRGGKAGITACLKASSMRRIGPRLYGEMEDRAFRYIEEQRLAEARDTNHGTLSAAP